MPTKIQREAKYIYVKSEPALWTVGYWLDGYWKPESDYESEASAAARVRWLNGDGHVAAIMQEIVDTPPWAYTYRERPDDLIEIRQAELEEILRAHLCQT